MPGEDRPEVPDWWLQAYAWWREAYAARQVGPDGLAALAPDRVEWTCPACGHVTGFRIVPREETVRGWIRDEAGQPLDAPPERPTWGGPNQGWLGKP